jgi:Flp pilus assembly protein TadD
MKRVVVAVLLWVSGAAHAADTGSAPDPAPEPAKSEKELTDARAAIKKKDWNAALTALAAAEKKDPSSADVHNLKGYSLRNAGKVDEGIKAYEVALKLDPMHKGAHEYIGQAYLTKKQPEKAKQHLAQLEKICGKNCEEYQDLQKAIAAYKP